MRASSKQRTHLRCKKCWIENHEHSRLKCTSKRFDLRKKKINRRYTCPRCGWHLWVKTRMHHEVLENLRKGRKGKRERRSSTPSSSHTS